MNDAVERIGETVLEKLKNHKSAACAAGSDDDLTVVDSVRLYHGRGQSDENLKGWCIDLHFPFLIIFLYSEDCDNHLNRLLEILSPHLKQVGIAGVYCQRRYLPLSPTSLVWGEVASALFAKRKGLRYTLNLDRQNVGFFLDIEPARRWLENYLSNAKAPQNILNLFAFTCTFSVVAKVAGADSVMNVDLSRSALNIGRENHRLNGVSCEGIHFASYDVLKSWGRLKKSGPYQVIIADPPSFQKGSFIARKHYPKVIRKCCEMLDANGVILACLNAPEISRPEFTSLVEQGLGGNEDLGFDCEYLQGSADFKDSNLDRALKMLLISRN